MNQITNYSSRKREKAGIIHLKNPKAFIDYSQIIDDLYENLKDNNPTKKRKVLIAFDDTIVGIKSNEKLKPIVSELFMRGRKVNISLVLILQSYFPVIKNLILNATHYLIMKIRNKRELQHVALNHSSDTEYKDFIKFYKEYTKELFSFLVIMQLHHQTIHYDLERTFYKLIVN